MSLTPTQYRVLDIVTANPGQIEKRRDFDGTEFWYQDGRRSTAIAGKALSYLLAEGLIRVTRQEVRTVGLTQPRKAWVVYAV